MRRKRFLVFLMALSILEVFAVSSFAGALDPGAPPGPTMKPLDEVPPAWSQTLPASERFKSVLSGAGVLDKETGLVWEQSPSATPLFWEHALNICRARNIGGRRGWRLPTLEELYSLVDDTQSNPSLPAGHPFSNVQPSGYWSATTPASVPNNAFVVSFGAGCPTCNTLFAPLKQGIFETDKYYIWCMRGGYGYEGR